MDAADPNKLFAQALELHRAGRLEEAEAAYRAVLGLTASVNAVTNLAAVVRNLGRPGEAAALLSRAAASKPDDPEIPYNLGLCFTDLADWPAAQAAYERAIELSPRHDRAQLNLSHVLLWRGRYREAWPLYEARRRVPGQGVRIPEFAMPEWCGEPLAGKTLLVWREQGLGDEIQFSRFLPALTAQGAKVTFACLDPNVELLGQLAQTCAAAGPLPEADYWIPLMSVPGRLDIALEGVPSAPYLTAPDRDVRASARVGVVCAGNPTQPKNAIRSMSPQAAQSLLSLPVMSLHPTDTGARDMADTAAIIAKLDLVVSVCTSVAHLAGALGKPCWVMLPHVGPDWRWLHGRIDSPWYPSARLYRQSTPGDWMDLVERVSADLDRAGLV